MCSIAPAGLPDAQASAGEAPFILQFARLPLLGKLARFANLKAYVRAALKKSFFDDARVREEMVARQWLLLRRAGNRQALLERLAERAPDALADKLGAITAPVLLLWGAEDERAPVALAMRYQEALPQAELVVFDKVGHFVQEETPVDSAAVVGSFLLGMPAATAASARALSRIYGMMPPLPAAPIKPVEIAPLGPVQEPPRLPGP